MLLFFFSSFLRLKRISSEENLEGISKEKEERAVPLVVSLFLSTAVCLTSSDGHQGAHVVLPAAAASPGS
jgi:hypothetical protein